MAVGCSRLAGELLPKTWVGVSETCNSLPRLRHGAASSFKLPLTPWRQSPTLLLVAMSSRSLSRAAMLSRSSTRAATGAGAGARSAVGRWQSCGVGAGVGRSTQKRWASNKGQKDVADGERPFYLQLQESIHERVQKEKAEQIQIQSLQQRTARGQFWATVTGRPVSAYGASLPPAAHANTAQYVSPPPA